MGLVHALVNSPHEIDNFADNSPAPDFPHNARDRRGVGGIGKAMNLRVLVNVHNSQPR
jgi:hypothetical protein